MLGFDLDVDLGAERILAAERETEGKLEKVAIEIKSFLSPSFMRDFHQAVGQYTNTIFYFVDRKRNERCI
nr:element excision factor XisH family protein [Spirosoma aerolatum]